MMTVFIFFSRRYIGTARQVESTQQAIKMFQEQPQLANQQHRGVQVKYTRVVPLEANLRKLVWRKWILCRRNLRIMRYVVVSPSRADWNGSIGWVNIISPYYNLVKSTHRGKFSAARLFVRLDTRFELCLTSLWIFRWWVEVMKLKDLLWRWNGSTYIDIFWNYFHNFR